MTTIRMVIDVIVLDEDALNQYAEERMAACWGERFAEETTDLPSRVYEALVASNENPSPSDYGIEIRREGHGYVQPEDELTTVIDITFTFADVDEMARSHGISREIARHRALSWGKHIEETMSGYCNEQLESVIVYDQP